MGGPQVSETYINNMSFGLQQWVTGAKTGNVKWGFFRFEKIGGKAQGVNVKTPGTNLSLNLPNLFLGFGMCCKRHGLERVLSFFFSAEKKQHFDDIYVKPDPVAYKERILDALEYICDNTTRDVFDTHLLEFCRTTATSAPARWRSSL